MKKILMIFVVIIVFLQCAKNEIPDTDKNLVYHSLVAEKGTILPGENVNITATASGSSLSYFWSASRGDILGSGNKVVYAPSPCHIGTNTITCKITNGNDQSESKSVTIVVLED